MKKYLILVHVNIVTVQISEIVKNTGFDNPDILQNIILISKISTTVLILHQGGTQKNNNKKTLKKTKNNLKSCKNYITKSQTLYDHHTLKIISSFP